MWHWHRWGHLSYCDTASFFVGRGWGKTRMGSPGLQKIAFAALAVLVALAGVGMLDGGGL
jgi:hypothetical protein